MAEGQKKGLIRITLLMMLIGITVVLVLAPASKVENALLQERFYITKTTGEFSEYQQWTQAVRLASPVIQMCGGKDGAGEAVVLEKLKAPLYNQQKIGTWVAKRGATCQAVAKAVTYRLVGSFMWAPLLLPLLFAAIFDAIMERKVRNCRFSFPSPGIHHMTTWLLRTVVALLLLSLIAPFTVHPLFYLNAHKN